VHDVARGDAGSCDPSDEGGAAVSRSVGGAEIRVEVWPSASGTLHFPFLAETSPGQRVDAVMSGIAPGSAVVVDDELLRDGLLARGAVQVRHLHGMSHSLRDVPTPRPVPGVTFRPWQSGDADSLAAALVAAYGPGHPDPAGPDQGAAATSLRHTAEDPDNPLIGTATQVAVVDGAPIGAALVLRSEHVSDWCGPWLMNTFRAPDPTLPGVGAAMLSRALEALRADGETSLGLAVTSTNPARRVYVRVGFDYHFEGWVLVLPE
jgi:GNAT superfamily N-acetyltransferase